MKKARQIEGLAGRRVAIWIASGVLFAGVPILSSGINAVAQASGGSVATAPAAQQVPAPGFSAGVADIVKMADAKVDAEVIKAYIQTSPTAYNPTANEIIALKNRGVGSDLLTAMLQRGAEVRSQARVATPPAAPQPAPGAAAPQYAPAYAYGTQPAYPVDYAYPAASYVSYPSTVYYYGGYSGGYSYPWYWPSFYFGWGGYPYRGYCGYPYYSCGYRSPYCYNGWGRGGYYGGHTYYGGSAYYRNGSYYRGGAYYGNRAYTTSVPRSTTFATHGAGYRGFSASARPVGFSGGASPGFRAGSSFTGHAASFSSRGGGFSGHAASFGGRSGGFGGRSMGRGR